MCRPHHTVYIIVGIFVCTYVGTTLALNLLQCTLAKTHPNFKCYLLAECACFSVFLSQEVLRRASVREILFRIFYCNQPLWLDRVFVNIKTTQKVPKVGILCSNLLQFSDVDSPFWEEFPITFSKIYFKVYFPCKIYWGPIYNIHTIYIIYTLYLSVTIWPMGELLPGCTVH